MKKNNNSELELKEAKKYKGYKVPSGLIEVGENYQVPNYDFDIEDAKDFKAALKYKKKICKKYSGAVLDGAVISTTGKFPDINNYAIEMFGVKKTYLTGSVVTQILKGIDLKIEKSKFVVILGPSGSGKTTMLNIISGLDEASEGDVFVVGNNLSLLRDSHLTMFRRNNIGFIFQQYNLLSNLTSRENAEVGENLSVNDEDKLTIEEIFETIGMTEQIDKYPHQMSGGQQQRVSIARALAKNPAILFGDEPTGALDEEMGRRVLEILVDVNKKLKTTVIIVTHNANIAEVADMVVHVKNGVIDSIKENSKPKKPSEIEWS